MEIEWREGFKFFSEDICAENITAGGVDFMAMNELHMAWLAFDEEAIDHFSVFFVDDTEVDTEADEGKEVHAFVRVNEITVAEDAVSAADFIEEAFWFFF